MKAKSLKKPSDEDRSRLKKSKSEKQKRRRSSNSSDSGRKKPRKSKKLKKKPRKKRRQVSTPSTPSSYSSDFSISTCSTCEKRKASHSRSPIYRGNGKSKLRKGRLSTGSKYKGRERGRSRRRSRSCSTCSSSSTRSDRSLSTDRSRSPSRSKKLRKGREKAQVSRRAEWDRDEGDKVIPSDGGILSSSKDEENKIQRGTEEVEPIAEASDKVVPEKMQNDDTKKTGVVDVELILRQKALENYIKFHKVKKCGNVEERSEPVSNEPNEEAGSVPGAMVTDKEKEESILDEPTKVITDMDLTGKGEIVPISVKRPKLRSVIVIPAEREASEDNTVIGTCNTGEVPNGIEDVPNHVEDEQNKGSEPNPNPNPSSSVASGLRNDAGTVRQHETTTGGVDTGGAQYKKKTFSRMHDGETVQVSYNVYIPKKAAALARRKIQRGETSTS